MRDTEGRLSEIKRESWESCVTGEAMEEEKEREKVESRIESREQSRRRRTRPRRELIR